MFKHQLDSDFILRKKKSIKKELLLKNNLIKKNIAILGGSTISEIKNILELFLLDNGIKVNFYESEYNKYYEDALFGNEDLDKFNPDIVYIHTTNQNIIKYPDLKDSEDEIKILLNNEIQRYKSIWSSLSKFDCAIIQNNFDYTIDRSLGNLDCYDIHGKTYFINQLNNEFAKEARKIKFLYINDINYLSSYIGLKNWFDKSLWHQAKYALSMNSIPELAFNISKIMNAIFGKTKKCLVLDLDNTCWGGVIGDDGVNGIYIGTETAIAESYTSFQKYTKELKQRGITLAVCSKNDFKNAKEGFEHPESVLRFDDFTSFKATWDPKHENIMDIAKEINIGIDSLVFIDDNAVERDIVSSQISSVAVPDVGNDVIHFIDHIDRNGYFEPISLLADDINRNKYYEDNKKRVNEESIFKSYDEFLISLEMTADIKSFSPIYLNRITQLANKTNQFNLTTKKYTAGEIENIASNNEYIKIYGRLIDKYGDNGLIAITIGRIKDNQCHIDLWLMSCRVLKRDMEFAMLDEVVRQCKEQDITEIIGYYYRSAKNNMVSDLYEKFGFLLSNTNNEDTVWKLNISNYENENENENENKNKSIRVNVRMKDELLNIIYKNAPTQEKKIKVLFNEFPQMELDLESFLLNYKKFMLLESISVKDIANSYLEMLDQVFFCRKEFLYSGQYHTQNQNEAFEHTYNDEKVMTNYMLALALSQFLWKHHYKIFTFYKSIVQTFDSKSNILEVGSGHGLFLLEILNHNENLKDIDVVDISKSSIRMTQNILKSMENEYIDKIVFYNYDINLYKTNKKYNFITMGEVLEHVDNPLSILNSLYNLLSEDGELFITSCANCPAIDHVYLFNNVDEIRVLAKKAGFKIKSEMVAPSVDKNDDYLEKNKVDISYAALLTK
ncbi:HAD-superfamily phosphatase subfamily IIIC:FkbH-like domain protein [Psychromonas ingrahamii 37]|uniref:HAD-superfamily phosphatase subfamily IIIC:FkbH-like domain protein n=1 Tax=Psychromonas ingrahamii (strain DSM 17664 / CCUG 51855 / 37) TaxID=357804 RepID=A1SVB3_PSYIN|nr:HAD-IIIC family phosphatase [Psychromonas ingrahamii]ABM03428.1 HAD-superfamily phosphatase subfamily IIIC:FkbH-like domain protein [Psychromonas ingrahamii 37]